MRTRPLRRDDVEAALALTQSRPYAHCFLAALLERGAIDDLVGVHDGGELQAIASIGANCVPTDLDAATSQSLGDFLATNGRRSASIVGRASDVELVWAALDGRWGPARDRRLRQPLMALASDPLTAADPLVRRTTADDFDAVFPCCVEMFTGEVGISPVAHGMERAYRRRIADAIAAGRSFARFGDDGRVEFKTEIGSISKAACQLQGVWVRPDLRGSGIGSAGVAAVATIAMRDIAPAVVLYVNDFNTSAIRAYERTGFVQVDTFSTVFF